MTAHLKRASETARPARLLFYVEPLPIRESWTAYQWVGVFWLNLANGLDPAAWDVRFLANRQTLALMEAHNEKLTPGLTSCSFLEISDALEERLRGFAAQPWWPVGAMEWRELLCGTGEISAAVEADLARLRQERFDFDAVVVWGLNGAVRRFCDRLGLVCLHGEMGATRHPLPTCFYYDPLGSHAHGLFPRVTADELPPPHQAWVGYSSAIVRPRLGSRGRKSALVPLQLCDDANMIGAPDGIIRLDDQLRRVLPLLSDAGFDIIVKGHPQAPLTPTTKAAQDECTELVRGYPAAQMDHDPTPRRWLSRLVGRVRPRGFDLELFGFRGEPRRCPCLPGTIRFIRNT